MGTKRIPSKSHSSVLKQGLPKSRFSVAWLIPFSFGVIATGICFVAASASKTSTPQLPIAPTAESATSSDYPRLDQLLALSDEQLAEYDVAVLNLRAAEGLPGAEKLDIAQCCRTLDRWADHVRHETDRHLYKFRQNPKEYENSEGYFRMLTLITVLQQDLKVRYNSQRIHDPDFRNSLDLFIHGMIGSSNGGTCSSMPVLYAAVARRLGYPVHLVLAQGHIFCRWENSRDRFNIEGAGIGMNMFDDSYYRKWPIPISDQEMERGVYLRNLTPAEELGVFLSARGYCLEDNGRLSEAYLAYAHAYQLSSGNPEYLVGLKLAIDKTLMPIARREGKLPTHERIDLPPLPSHARKQLRQPGMPQPINPFPSHVSVETAKPVVPNIDPLTVFPREVGYPTNSILNPTPGNRP